MGRPQNHVESVQVTLALTPGIHVYLVDLVATHLYGKSPTEAAGRLIEKQIEALLEKGILKKRDNFD
jgi:hypothetical protein